MTTVTDRFLAELICEEVMKLSDDIRYVALYRDDKLQSVSRPDRVSPGAWDADKHEEIVVNPTVITLLRQRGRIRSESIQAIIVEYGTFTQFVQPVREGHISVSFAHGSRYSRLLARIKRILSKRRLLCEAEQFPMLRKPVLTNARTRNTIIEGVGL
jgi:hypothetical protein